MSFRKLRYGEIYIRPEIVDLAKGDTIEMKETWLSYFLGSIRYCQFIFQSKYTRGTRRASLSQ